MVNPGAGINCTQTPAPKDCVTQYTVVAKSNSTPATAPDGTPGLRWSPGAGDVTYTLAEPTPIESIVFARLMRAHGGASAAASIHVVRTVKAQAAVDYGWFCVVWSDQPEIINISGNYWARGSGGQSCAGTDQDSISGALYRCDGGCGALASSTGIDSVTEHYDCNHTRSLLYEQLTNGFALKNNQWYISPTATNTAYHTCPG